MALLVLLYLYKIINQNFAIEFLWKCYINNFHLKILLCLLKRDHYLEYFHYPIVIFLYSIIYFVKVLYRANTSNVVLKNILESHLNLIKKLLVGHFTINNRQSPHDPI